MTPLFLLFSVLLAAVIGLLFLLLSRMPRHQQVADLRRELGTLQAELGDLKVKQLESSRQTLSEQSAFYRQSQNLMTEVFTKLGILEKTSRQIEDFGRDLVQLKDILKAPKLRGGLGEFLLEDLLSQVLPGKHFTSQYRFSDGSVVDAAIKLGDRLVPIDAKFPLESFQRMIAAKDPQTRIFERKEFVRSVRKRIDEIAEKYIREEEGTYNFALMYVPAENIYYEIIVADDISSSERNYRLQSYALERKVVPVSPGSLYSYLMAIVLGLKGFRVEEQARAIMRELSLIQTAFGKFYTEYSLVGKYMRQSLQKYDESVKKAERFDRKLGDVTGVKTDLLEKEDRG
ncbi:MAG: DNA recombination protein RmuC [Spirochaetales bacterium]|nr:MAG: DNA recombination protein RmuC [Spirochaetales bacterium]